MALRRETLVALALIGLAAVAPVTAARADSRAAKAEQSLIDSLPEVSDVVKSDIRGVLGGQRGAALPADRMVAATEQLMTGPSFDQLHELAKELGTTRLRATASRQRLVEVIVERLVAGGARVPSNVDGLVHSGAVGGELEHLCYRFSAPGGDPRAVARALSRARGAIKELDARLTRAPASDRARLRDTRAALTSVVATLAGQVGEVKAAQKRGIRAQRVLAAGIGPSVQIPGVVAVANVYTFEKNFAKKGVRLGKRAQLTTKYFVFGPRRVREEGESLRSFLDPRKWRQKSTGKTEFIKGAGYILQVREGNTTLDHRGRPAREVVAVLPGVAAVEMSANKVGGYIITPGPVGIRMELGVGSATIQRLTYMAKRAFTAGPKKLKAAVKSARERIKNVRQKIKQRGQGRRTTH